MFSWRRIALLLLMLTLIGSQKPPAIRAEDGPEGDAFELRLTVASTAADLTAAGAAGFEWATLPGAPRLPFTTTLVALPPTGEWSLTIMAGDFTILPQPFEIGPAPSPLVPRSPQINGEHLTALPQTIRMDPDIYTRDAFYPASPVQAGEVQWQAGQRLLPVRIFPFQYNPVTGKVRHYPRLQVVIQVEAATAAAAEVTIAAASPLSWTDSAQGALRIYTGEGGFHRLSYEDLAAAGLPLASIDPATLAMSWQGQPVAVQVLDGGDGQIDAGDALLFYAEPTTSVYMTSNVYWLHFGGEAGPRIGSRLVSPAGDEPILTHIYRTARVEPNLEYRPDFPLPMGRDRWFDTPLTVSAAGPAVNARSYTLTLPAPAGTGTATARASAFGRDDQAPEPDHSFALYVNNQSAGVHTWEAGESIIASANIPAAWLTSGQNQITLEAALSQLPGLTSYWFAPDWAEITYPALAQAEGDRLLAEGLAQSPGDGLARVAVGGFSTAAVRVYDLRTPLQPVQVLATQAQPADGGYEITFWDDAGADPAAAAYYLTAENALLAPVGLVLDSPSQWRSPDHAADYIAIVHSSLAAALQPLLDHRAAEGLRVVSVDVQDIYDEFSYGHTDPQAIRDFLAYAYGHWNQGEARPRYVLLVGHGHFDFKGHTFYGRQDANLIPPYPAQVDPVLGEIPADNRYVSMDGPEDYLPEMHIGRIPAQTPAEVAAIVAKTLAYEGAEEGEWQTRVYFAAGHNQDPEGAFHDISNDIRQNWLPAGYDDRHIYEGLDFFSNEEGRALGRTAFDQGAVLIQWFGHASQFRWGKDLRALNIYDPPLLQANTVWPLAAHFSCLSGQFTYLSQYGPSLAETLLLASKRGTVADIAPTGYHGSGALQVFNRVLIRIIFLDRVQRAGEAMDAAKRAFFAGSLTDHDVIDSTMLFGDPALRLRLPAAAQQPAASATQAGGATTLSWAHDPANAGGYEVWRSPQPYFAAGDPGSERMALLPPPAAGQPGSYTDPAGAETGYYLVRGLNRVAETSSPSPTVGRFLFTLTTP